MRHRGSWMVLMLFISLAASCGGTEGGADHNPGDLYPDRANQFREDQERRIGESVKIGGYTATVTEAPVDEEGQSIRVNIEITNRDEEPQRIDSTQWTLVNPRGQTVEVTTATFPVTELAGDAMATAAVSFVVDPEDAGPTASSSSQGYSTRSGASGS